MTLYCHICGTAVSVSGVVSATCPHGPMAVGGTFNPVTATVTDIQVTP